MKINDVLLAELKHEAAGTRKLLSLIPFEKADFKPHEKSMTLKRLATHVAEIAGWWKTCLLEDELDFAKSEYKPKDLRSTEEIVALHDQLTANAEKILSDVSDEEFQKPWTMRTGETIYFTMPKAAVVRTWCMSHLYHHRGQLTVYLRMLNVPLPSTYGPSADTENM